MKFKTLKILFLNCFVPPMFSFPVGISLSLLRGEHSLILFWEQCAISSCNNNSSVGVVVVVVVVMAAVAAVVVVVW